MNIERFTAPSSKGEITLYKLTNATGASVTLSSLGAAIVSVEVPDRDGHLDDVALGYADPADYLYDGPCSGKIPGRYANRIAKGHFTLDGRTYSLAINNGPNALHGGPEGFQNQIWDSEETEDGVQFTLVSPDGDEGYPGTLEVTAIYTWGEDNVLRLELHAEADAKTVVNLTNHCYWNLNGHNSGSVLSHRLRMPASHYLPTDDTLIPTGEIAPVKDTPMDFTVMKEIGRDIHQDFPALNYGKGYDACWVVDQWDPDRMRVVAELYSPESGRLLTVCSSQPGAQVYTGNWLAGSPKNKAGRSYNDYDGVAIECQHFPDSPNRPDFPSTVVDEGVMNALDEVIEFRFTTI